MSAAPVAFFHPAGSGRSGQRLYLYHAPAPHTSVRGAVLYVHPLAEEMNKARRMAALQSRRLAAAGYAVLQHDLLGCGDSSGDFGDASWDDWIADTVEAALWLHQRHPVDLWLWGLRAGALLACAAAQRLPMASRFLLWQPATSGRQVLHQFLRLEAAGRMLDGSGKGVVEGLHAQLAAGRSVDVAGYRLAPTLASGLEAATLRTPGGAGARAEWFEVQSQPARPGGGELSPAAARVVTDWQRAGAVVCAHVATGPAFWQTTEIEDAPALLDATCAALAAQDGPMRRGSAPSAAASDCEPAIR